MYILEFISLDIALVTPLMWMENVETRLFRPLLPQENLPRAHEAKRSINKITSLCKGQATKERRIFSDGGRGGISKSQF